MIASSWKGKSAVKRKKTYNDVMSYGKVRYANFRGIGSDFMGACNGSDKRFSNIMGKAIIKPLMACEWFEKNELKPAEASAASHI